MTCMVSSTSRPRPLLRPSTYHTCHLKPNPSHETLSINDKIVDGAPLQQLKDRWLGPLSPKIYIADPLPFLPAPV
jgi:hypothetical protein